MQIDQRRIARLQGLLSWAVEFVEREVKCLVDSNRDPKTGDCDDDDISVELTDVRRWLAEAREALK